MFLKRSDNRTRQRKTTPLNVTAMTSAVHVIVMMRFKGALYLV